MNLQDQAGIVTGGGRGIGRAICLSLAAQGCRVVVVDRDGALAAETTELVREYGGDAAALQGDVVDPSLSEAAVREAVQRWGRLDLLVNNVGVFPEAPFLEMSLDLWHASFEVNLTSFFLFSQQAAREMVKRGAGSIVNISSLDARNGVMNFASYAAAKAGVLGLTHTLALELGSRGVRVNAICPGIIESDMTRARIAANRDGYLSKIPLGRIGRPEDIAEVVSFLCSPGASYITGQAINVNGGWRFD